MLYFLYGSVDHPRHTVVGSSFVIKLWTDRMYDFGDIEIFRFWQFGLKCHYLLVGLGAHFLQMMSLLVLTTKQTVI